MGLALPPCIARFGAQAGSPLALGREIYARHRNPQQATKSAPAGALFSGGGVNELGFLRLGFQYLNGLVKLIVFFGLRLGCFFGCGVVIIVSNGDNVI